MKNDNKIVIKGPNRDTINGLTKIDLVRRGFQLVGEKKNKVTNILTFRKA